MKITAELIKAAAERLELAKTESESLDTFAEKYGMDDATLSVFTDMMRKNIDLLSEALVKDLGSGEPATYVPAFLAAMSMTSFMLGFVSCLMAEE